VAARSERERLSHAGARTGVFTGAYAVNPVDGRQVPIWVSDYVLSGYGTGAVFGCPAHDERDYSFATELGLPIIEVIKGGDISTAAYLGDGPHVNSGFLDGLDIAAANERVAAWLPERGRGQRKTTCHLRDWLFSR
jgi:leucyl-tRNA synthetase